MTDAIDTPHAAPEEPSTDHLSDVPGRTPSAVGGSLDMPEDDEPETPLERGRYAPGTQPGSLDDEEEDEPEPTPSPDAVPSTPLWYDPEPA